MNLNIASCTIPGSDPWGKSSSFLVVTLKTNNYSPLKNLMDSDFQNIPDGWTNCFLFDVCRPKQWPTISIKQLSESGYPVYGANGIIGFHKEYNHEKPTILITCRGATCGTINISKPFSWVNGNAMALDDLEERCIDLTFLSYSLRNRGFADTISGSAQPQITREGLQYVNFLLPPLNEQRRIVAKIEELTTHSRIAREALAEVPALIEQFRRSVLAAAFRGDLTADWDAQIIDFSDLIESAQNGLSKRSGDQGEFVNVLRLADLKNGNFEGLEPRQIQLTPEEELKYILHKNDLVCIRVNGSADLVGRTFVFNETKKWAFCDHFIRFKLKNNIDPGFLNLYFSSTTVRLLIEDLFVSTAGQKTVSQKTLGSIPVPVPSFDIQKELVKKVNQSFSRIGSIFQSSCDLDKELTTFDQSILAKAFRGELVPQDPNDEPAALLLDRIRAERSQPSKAPRQRRSKKDSQTQTPPPNFQQLSLE